MTSDRVSAERLAEMLADAQGEADRNPRDETVYDFTPEEAASAFRELQHLRSPVTVSDEMVERACKTFIPAWSRGRVNEMVKASTRVDMRDALTAALVPAEQHPDDLAVDRFAAAMKAKLAKKRAEGRGGWERKDECSAEFLSRLLREHVEKGDPLDVGNLAMMLHQRGERIMP